ncbi:MAG TPA: sigma-70 family RNA polymerase sigma factor [Ktedonobacteraceae bacterium]
MEMTAAQATEALIQSYSKLVFHVIYGLTGHWEESQDLTQETFLQAFRGINAARAKAGNAFQPKPWLLKIAVNTVHMAQRRQRGLRFIPFATLQPGQKGFERMTEDSPASEEFEGAGNLETIIAERDTVQRCMEQLPETLRTPLLLSIVAGFSQRELAGILALNEATVRQRLSRARKAFQRLYARECDEHIHLGELAPRSGTGISQSRGHLRRRSAALASAVL